MSTIEQRTLAYIGRVLEGYPGEGSGLHGWLYSAANSIWFGFNSPNDVENAILSTIKGTLSESRKRTIAREVQDAVRNARSTAQTPDWYRQAAGQPIPINPAPTFDPGPRWPRKDYTRILEMATERTYPVSEVPKHSPATITDGRMTETIIDALFPGNPWLCVAKAQDRHRTARREQWRGRLSEHPFIVPNVMSTQWGEKATGGRSMRCNGNVGLRRYLVVEFDFARHDKAGKPTFDIDLLNRLEKRGISVADLCASIICELQFGKPTLRLIVSSGGKSLHSWWDCQGLPEGEVETFFSNACALGADPATWTRCQLVRMPDGTRDNGTRQQVLLFNPEPVLAS